MADGRLTNTLFPEHAHGVARGSLEVTLPIPMPCGMQAKQSTVSALCGTRRRMRTSIGRARILCVLGAQDMLPDMRPEVIVRPELPWWRHPVYTRQLGACASWVLHTSGALGLSHDLRLLYDVSVPSIG